MASTTAQTYEPSVLVETADLPEEEWLEYRRQGIGGIHQAAKRNVWASLDSRMTWRFALWFSNMLWIAFWQG